MTRKMYLTEPHTYSGSAKITAIISGERPAIRLDQTWFHPQGGGQKADRGRIGTSFVLHVAHSEDSVDHVVDSVAGLESGMIVQMEIDQPWRALNARYHTAGHLIACVIEELVPSFKAVSGHQWPGEGRVEFDATGVDVAVCLDAVNDRIQRDIQADLPVMIEGEPHSDRKIRIGEYSPISCGGTHIHSLSLLSVVKAIAIKKKSGRVRVSYEVSEAA